MRLRKQQSKGGQARKAVAKKTKSTKKSVKRWGIKKILARVIPKRALVIAGGAAAAVAGALALKKRGGSSETPSYEPPSAAPPPPPPPTEAPDEPDAAA